MKKVNNRNVGKKATVKPEVKIEKIQLADVEVVDENTKEEATVVTKTATKKISTASKTAEKAASRVKKETKKVVKEMKECAPEVMVQFEGRECTMEQLVKQIKDQYASEGHEQAITSLKVYIKLEDGCAYYVINDDCTGQVAF